jgi:hypothetical protein
LNFEKSKLKNILANRANDKKLDITSFYDDGVPVHSVDLHAACPRCLAAEASKPGHNDGEFFLLMITHLTHIKKYCLAVK